MKKVKIKNRNKDHAVGKIVCVGRNYADHAKEMGNEIPKFPIIFLKAPSTLIFNKDKIIHPNHSEEMHHEVELVLLIGNDVKNADDQQALDSIIAYGVGLDMTLRDLQRKYRDERNPWTFAKNFDTAAVISDLVSIEDYKLTGKETISLSVNDIEKQNSILDQMLFSPIEIVKYISSYITLNEGDLIYTGTPAGVGKVISGDKIKANISNISFLENDII